MELDEFSLNKCFVHVGDARVAYYEAGTGRRRRGKKAGVPAA
ncbi:MAG TPA: hypothetical protein VF982_04400 [Anaerolineales bacterium]